jgi:hypothetical protein
LYDVPIMILLLALLLTNPAIIADVDSLFGYGADHASEVQALEILERAAADAPADYDILWRLARSYYWAGDAAAPKVRLDYLLKGIDAGKRAVAQQPQGVEGHFWLGAAWGGFCQLKGGLTAFRNVGHVRSELEIVLRLNDAYEEASVYTALGEIDRQLPRLFGGDLKRGIARLERGLKIAPHNAEIKLSLAQSYLEAKRKDEGLFQLRELLQLELTSPRAPVGRRAQKTARELLNKLDKK